MTSKDYEKLRQVCKRLQTIVIELNEMKAITEIFEIQQAARSAAVTLAFLEVVQSKDPDQS
jgi:hypothetical protein